jgi:hypothetical protein
VRNPAVNDKVEHAIEAACLHLALRVDSENPLSDQSGIRPFLLHEGKLPQRMYPYVREQLTKPKGQSAQTRNRRAKPIRDNAILSAVASVNALGFSVTRSHTARPRHIRSESACSIVHKALTRLGVKGMTERTIEDIWSRQNRP